MYYVFATPSQVSFHQHLCPLSPLLLPTPFPSGNHPTIVCLWGFFLRLIPSPRLPKSPPLTSVSLFSVSTSLFLFRVLVYFVHEIPHVSEIIWHLSFCRSIREEAIFIQTDLLVHFIWFHPTTRASKMRLQAAGKESARWLSDI